MRVRSWHFYVSGAIGGAIGFLPMEMVRDAVPPTEGLQATLALGFQFSAFGLAVGAALGMTEGVVLRRIPQAIYGLVLGLVFGALGGFAGGATGQAIFSLLPMPEPPPPIHNDVAVVLDASLSMDRYQVNLWRWEPGNDPQGLRKVAARQLVKQLGASDRVTVVDFAGDARVLIPVTTLSSSRARNRVLSAISTGGLRWGTNLSAGLSTAIGELVRNKKANHHQHLIFLTDGEGTFAPWVIEPAKQNGITIYAIGLGSGVNRNLLEGAIAKPTGGRYYPVRQADQLKFTFATILEENIRVDLTSHDEEASGDDRLRFALRVLGWLAMGLLVGAGQGIRENTREDLLACTLGGAVGGLIGGALFEPVSGSIQMAKGLVGRGVADVVVGACIGGSMRLAQRHLVELRTRPTTSLLKILPEKSTSLVESPTPTTPGAAPGAVAPSRSLQQASGFRGLVLQVKHAVEGEGTTAVPRSTAPATASVPSTTARPAASRPRRPLAFYQSRYPGNRSKAIVTAYGSGHYSVEELAEFFNLTPARIKELI